MPDHDQHHTEPARHRTELTEATRRQERAAEHAGHGAGGHHAMMEREFRTRFIITAILAVPVLALSPMVQEWLGFVFTFPGRDIVLWVLASIIAIWGAWPFYRGAVEAIPTGTLDMNVLVSLAVGAGYLFSTASTFLIEAPEFYWEIATLVVFLLFGHWMEMRAMGRATGALEELVKLIPPEAHRVRDDHVETVPTEDVNKGDILLVRPGDQVPIDGEVVDGESDVNEAMVTGESRPVPKQPGDQVIGGTINGEGAFRMRVTAVGEDTAIAHIMDVIRRAQSSRTRTQRMADRAAHFLTLAAVIVGGSAFIYWITLGNETTVFSLLRTVSVLIIACPHALGLAIPMVVIIASALGAHAGILLRDANAAEVSARLNAIIFDKTGTLTKGEFGVTDVMAADRLSEDELLRITAAVEANSEHSLARGVVRSAEDRQLTVHPAREFMAVPGKGARAQVDDMVIHAGNRALMEEAGVDVSGVRDQVDALTSQGKTIIYVARNNAFAGLLALADVIRSESYETVRILKEQGVEVAMLTGDHKNVAAYVAGELNLDTYFAEVKPGEKADKVRSLQDEGKLVGMVGDGINDAPALVQAHVGIAIGAGTQVAIESADVVLVRNDPRDVVSLLTLSRGIVRKMRQNLVWATGYNVVAIPLAAGVLANYGIIVPPAVAALIMAASSIIVVINALFLRRLNIE